MPNLLENKSVLNFKKFLIKIDSSIKLIQLKSTARTAKDAAISLNKDVGSIVKSLIFKTNENDFFLCLVSGDKYISIDKLKLITKKNIIKATANEVKEHTGFSIGGVPPFGHLNTSSKIFIDENLSRFKIVYAAAGHPYVVFGISFEMLKRTLNEKLCSITE